MNKWTIDMFQGIGGKRGFQYIYLQSIALIYFAFVLFYHLIQIGKLLNLLKRSSFKTSTATFWNTQKQSMLFAMERPACTSLAGEGRWKWYVYCVADVVWSTSWSIYIYTYLSWVSLCFDDSPDQIRSLLHLLIVSCPDYSYSYTTSWCD